MNATIYTLDEPPTFLTNVMRITYDYDRNELNIVSDEGEQTWDMETDVMRVELEQ